MKKRLAAVSLALGISFSASLFAESVKMPNGQIYKNPVVMGKTPLGLDIAYDGGVAFWKFADLPETVQKKYGYDPVKASEYEKFLQEQKKDAMQRQVTQEAQREKYDVAAYAEEVRLYGLKIQNVEKQIQDYKTRAADFKSEEKDDDNKTMKLAETSLQESSQSNGGNVGWGYSTFGGGNNITQLMAVKTNDSIADQAKDDRFQANALRVGVYQLEHDLPIMKDTYAHMQARLSQMQAALADSNSAAQAVQAKATDFNTIQQRLTELTELHRKGVISDQEYNSKRDQIVNAM